MNMDVADELDFLSFYRREPPATWIGLCVKRGRRVVAFGLVVWNDHGAACGFFDRRQPVSAFTIHRAAYRILAALREVGEEALYCNATEAFPMRKNGCAGWASRRWKPSRRSGGWCCWQALMA